MTRRSACGLCARVTGAILPELAEPTRLALTFARRQDRMLFASLFALDARLARIVSATSEVLLGQMRLAWWRDRLREPIDLWPAGDVVLDTIAGAWGRSSEGLVDLVDGWETVLAAENKADGTRAALSEGRVAAMQALANRAQSRADREQIALAVKRWTLIDLAEHSSTPELAGAAFAEARSLPERPATLDRAMRPLVVLDGLGRRALRRNQRFLLGDRTSPLAALRLGIFGT